MCIYCSNVVSSILTLLFSDEMFKMHDILNDGYKEPGNEEKVRKHGCVFHCMMEKVGAVSYTLFLYIFISVSDEINHY